jgi:hypothetical protein
MPLTVVVGVSLGGVGVGVGVGSGVGVGVDVVGDVGVVTVGPDCVSLLSSPHAASGTIDANMRASKAPLIVVRCIAI